MHPDKSPTAIEHALTVDILKGHYPVGCRLPTVRELAAQHHVNPATIQRTVSRLETRGLISARQGSGLRVNDPDENGDISLMRFWLEAKSDEPEHARSMLSDLLEMRRMIAARMMVRHREAILSRVSELQAAASRLAEVTAANEALDVVRDADLAFARELLRATGNVVALSVFNTMAAVVTELPTVARAMYANPRENVDGVERALAILLTRPEDAESQLEEVLAESDARTLERYETLLRERSSALKGGSA